MKPERIILDINKDLTIIGSYESLQISIFIVTKGLRINTVVVSKARYAISAYFFITILIKSIANLLANRELIFKSK